MSFLRQHDASGVDQHATPEETDGQAADSLQQVSFISTQDGFLLHSMGTLLATDGEKLSAAAPLAIDLDQSSMPWQSKLLIIAVQASMQTPRRSKPTLGVVILGAHFGMSTHSRVNSEQVFLAPTKN